MAVSFQVLGMTADGRSVRLFEDRPVTGATTVGALVAASPAEVLELAEGATLLVNGERATLETRVVDGDEVSVIKVVAGG